MNAVLNPDALDANRQGQLNQKQKFGLLPRIMVGLLLVLVGLLCLYEVIVQVNAYTWWIGLIYGAIIWGAPAALVLAVAYLFGGRALQDLLGGQVLQIEGSSHKEIEPTTKGGRLLVYSVGEREFQISWFDIWKSLPQGHSVRAYYTPNSNILVNVEVLVPHTSRPEQRKHS